MNPKVIIEKAMSDGVCLSLSHAGTIKASGDRTAVNRWLGAIRENKAAILSALKTLPMTADEEQSIRAWLTHIDEDDPEIIADVLDKCQRDAEARAYFLWRSEEIQKPDFRSRSNCCGN